MSFFQAVSAARAYPVQQTGIVTDNLFIHYDASNVSGATAFDQSGNGFDATLYNGAYVGTFDGATAFITDGVNDAIYASLTHADFASVNYPVTMESWLYYSSTQAFTGSFAINHPEDTVDWLRHLIVSSSNYELGQVYTAFGGSFTSNQTSSLFSTSGWYHVVTVIETINSGLKHRVTDYLNGVSLGSTDSSYSNAQYTAVPWSEGFGTINVNINCLIRSTPSYYNARSGEHRFYSDALSPSEVVQNFNATKSKYGY